VAIDPELVEEQRFLDRAHEGLETMREESRQMLDSVLDLGRGGTPQSRTERDIVVRTSLARLAQLDIGDQGLCFGRIDQARDDEHGVGESFHIGRLAVSGPDREPLVVDWRAPIAAPFYRATGLDPQGLARRRHLAVRGPTVVGYEDEYFGTAPMPRTAARRDDEEESESGELLEDSLSFGGPGALLAALGSVRTGRMADIVGTIQREQDEIIRAPLAGMLLVQGGPGTGKTAVALHRAAYLLYTHRFPLERQGVLVVGPNPLFLRYIEQVLPSLGETGVTLSTVSGLVSEIRVRSSDVPEVARLKGDARMAKLMTRAVRARERRLRSPVDIPFGATVLRIDVEDSAGIVSRARRRPGNHNAKRRFVERQLTSLLVERYELFQEASLERMGPSAMSRGAMESFDVDDGGQSADEAERNREDLAAQLRRTPGVREALDRMWPRLAPHELVHDLFGAPALLAISAEGILSKAEQAMLVRPRSRSLDEVSWTAADAALVDEARAVLGSWRPQPARPRAADRRSRPERPIDAGFWPPGLDPSPEPITPVVVPSDEVRSFGHIVVDEAQDLSPMQLRMLARRSLSGSMTVVGDIAQATGAWTPTHWDEVAAHLSPRHPPRLVELTVSYRTPAEVVAIAARALRAAVPELKPPTPVRRSGYAPLIEQVSRGALAGRVAEVAADLLDAVAPGRTAVLAPELLLPELQRALKEHGLDPVDPRVPASEGLGAALVLLPASEAHGLEFDAVVVVEPAGMAEDPASGGERPPAVDGRGLRTLYVALTRPTQRLAVLHALPLPVDLAAD
jgi:DNA helicase IV